MKRSSPYFDLKFRVDCRRPPNPASWWETIAAFNNDSVALAYAKDCFSAWKRRDGWEYRVMKRTGRGWVEITKAER